jgi:hypothetical protein
MFPRPIQLLGWGEIHRVETMLRLAAMAREVGLAYRRPSRGAVFYLGRISKK